MQATHCQRLPFKPLAPCIYSLHPTPSRAREVRTNFKLGRTLVDRAGRIGASQNYPTRYRETRAAQHGRRLAHFVRAFAFSVAGNIPRRLRALPGPPLESQSDALSRIHYSPTCPKRLNLEPFETRPRHQSIRGMLRATRGTRLGTRDMLIQTTGHKYRISRHRIRICCIQGFYKLLQW